MTPLTVALLILFPAFALFLEKRFELCKKIGAIVICYAVGIFLGNSGIPLGSKAAIEEIVNVVIPIAIPLFIFRTDFIGWLKQSRSTVISYTVCITMVSAICMFSGVFFSRWIPEAWQVAGMLAGVYTGGTPNLTAIAQSLSTPSEIIILTNSIDMVTGSVFLFILLALGREFLKNFLHVLPIEEESNESVEENQSSILKGGSLGLLLSIVILGIAFGLSHLIFGTVSVGFIIFMISLLSIGLSFKDKIRNLSGPYEFGQYLLMIFCFGIGLMSNMNNFLKHSSALLVMITTVITLSIILHFILAKLFKIDRDTAVITCVASIFGPPFVPLIADRFKNQQMIIPGITTGLVGFAIGNFLGLLIAYSVKYLQNL